MRQTDREREIMNEEEEFKRLIKEWITCYSKRKGRDYYFNTKTGQSFWDYDEVVQHVKLTISTRKAKLGICNELKVKKSAQTSADRPTTSSIQNVNQNQP